MTQINKKLFLIRTIIVIFYLVGLAGFIIPVLSDYFKNLTPLVIILNFLLIAYFHHNIKNFKNLIIFFTVFVGGIAIEIAGVQTGLIFGNYHYGNGLGLKIFDTPLLIGINWLFLSYATTSMLYTLKSGKLIKALIASLLMVIYDLVLEQVAPHLDMWYWANNTIPLQNYIAWFFISLVFNSLLIFFKVNTSNKIAATVITTQFLFFVVLTIYFSF